MDRIYWLLKRISREFKLHERDHETLNFSNDDAFDLNSSDKLVRNFFLIKKYVDDYLEDYSYWVR